MTTPVEQDVADKAVALRKAWADAGRTGEPDIHVLIAARPSPDDLAAWADAGATELIWGVPDKPEPEILAYLDRLAGRVAR
jgi:hypothetical protein